MSDESLAQKAEEVARSIGERAENLYLTRQLLCSEAVLSAVNHGLGGGLTDDVAIRMASALPVGIGNSGCTCGGLSGAVLALGLFLGRDRPGASDKRGALSSAKVLHSRFKDLFGSSCCRVLSKDFKHDPRLHFKHCARLTAQAAELATLIILEKRPELIDGVDTLYVETRDTWLGSKLRQLVIRKSGS
jgi:C_GCAxxG_C_C family probable redox protein